MDRIVLEGMEFHGYHGVFEEEAVFGARFVVDLELELDLPTADRLEGTVDYSGVYARVQAQVVGRRYRLIEALAHAIADEMLASEARVERVRVRVHKPHAPLPGVVRDVYVEVQHDRAGSP